VRKIYQALRELKEEVAARTRAPDCRNERCRWLEGGYCPFCAPACPHGVRYDDPAACAICENST
jgi:hypothetical protein